MKMNLEGYSVLAVCREEDSNTIFTVQDTSMDRTLTFGPFYMIALPGGIMLDSCNPDYNDTRLYVNREKAEEAAKNVPGSKVVKLKRVIYQIEE